MTQKIDIKKKMIWKIEIRLDIKFMCLDNVKSDNMDTIIEY